MWGGGGGGWWGGGGGGVGGGGGIGEGDNFGIRKALIGRIYTSFYVHYSVMDLQGRPILNFNLIENLIYGALRIK